MMRILSAYRSNGWGNVCGLMKISGFLSFDTELEGCYYSIDKNILAYETYTDVMFIIQKAYKKLEDLGIPKEDIANILPLGMESKMVLKINARAILHMVKVRECTRAYWEFRKFIKELKSVVGDLDSEWLKIISYAKVKCELLGYCNEKNSCGRVAE